MQKKDTLHLPKHIILRDTTLREGLDVPGVEKNLNLRQRIRLAKEIYELGIREFDIVHPGRVMKKHSTDLARELKRLYGKHIVVHGGAYAHNEILERELDVMAEAGVDEVDLVMPLTTKRPPHSEKEKMSDMVRALALLGKYQMRRSVGFANSTQCSRAFLLKMCRAAAKHGAGKIVIYDSIGSHDPTESYDLISAVVAAVPDVDILYHCHNDLGLAVADSLLAVYGGAKYIDATVNGLGDRAGNASMEQLAVIFSLKGVQTGIDLRKMRRVSDLTEKLTGIKRAVNHPITGNRKVILSHVSPKHKPDKASFEILPKEITES